MFALHPLGTTGRAGAVGDGTGWFWNLSAGAGAMAGKATGTCFGIPSGRLGQKREPEDEGEGASGTTARGNHS